MCHISPVQYVYDTVTLKSFATMNLKISPMLKHKLDKLRILKTCFRRGRRGGKKTQRRIQTVLGNRPETLTSCPSDEARLPSVLTPVAPTPTPPSVENCTGYSLPGFFLTNTRSLMNKFEELEILLNQTDISPVDVAVITETWQPDEVPNDFLEFDGFNLFSTTRSSQRGGGVAVYLRDNIPVSVLSEVNVPTELECIWLRIQPHRLPRSVSGIVICAVYIPPKSEFQDLLINHIVLTLDSLKSKHPDVGVVILGDFNRTNISPLCRAHNLKQVVDKPTREDAILDLIVTNLKSLFNTPVVCSPIGRSDHRTVYWSSDHRSSKGRTLKRTVRPLRNHNLSNFGRWITSHSWSEVLDASNTSDKADAFYATMQKAMDIHFPPKVVKIHSQDKPWITPEIKELIKKRQIAFAEKKMYLWRFLRNKVIRAIDQAKRSFYNNRIQDLKTSDPSGWHKGIQLINNKCQQRPIISVPGVQQNDEGAIAEAINDNFASVSQSRPPINSQELPAFLPSRPAPQIQVWDMYNALRKINVKKAAGPDGLPGKLIREFACELSTPVTDIFNSSLSEGIVPQAWKDATIAPVPKETPARIAKLRPISLTPLLAKVCEGFVSRWVLEDISSAIDRNQYGSIKGSSTSHCLIEILDVFFKGTDKSDTVGTLVVTDFSKAFDCIDHTLAIRRLYELGTRCEIIPWLANFLTARRQRVQYQSALSEWKTLSCGVPQGTKLGPITFVAVINNAAEESATNSFKYVDDLSLAEVRPAKQPSRIGQDVHDLDTWAKDNHLTLNPSKCKVMQVCFKKEAPCPPSFQIAGSELEVVSETKILGLTVQSDLGWQSQVNSMVSKASRRLHMLTRLRRFGVPTEDLVSVYIGYIRPICEYAAPVWHSNITADQTTQLERIQKRACRIILGSKYDSYTETLLQLDLQTLQDRRWHLCHQFANKCKDSDRYRNWFPPNHSSHGMRLRHSKSYQMPKCNTNRYRNSAIPTLIDLLN